MIPEERRPAVARALLAAFGTSDCDDIRPRSGGLSTALVFRIIVGGRPYLLRLISHTQAMGDPTREFSSMQLGADAGIAPRIWYASVDDRILISDFVEAQPFPENLIPFIAPTIRTLHALPPFAPPKAGSYLDIADGFIRRLQAAQFLPRADTAEVFRRYAAVTEVYPRHDDMVASHNDLKPQNMVFDGTRLWLVDWEAAFLNDRYVDLAVAANFWVHDDADEEAYLATYFGEPAGEYRRARFFLMRQTLHLFYASFLLPLAASHASIEPGLDAPGFRAFHQDLLAGAADMTTAEARAQYAKVHLNEALRQMRTPRFEEAIARVAGGH